MTTDLDFDKLRAVAKAATPGPWSVLTVERIGMAPGPARFVNQKPGVTVCALNGPCTMVPDPEPQDNAEFIATFNPTLVLQLLDLAQREYERETR